MSALGVCVFRALHFYCSIKPSNINGDLGWNACSGWNNTHERFCPTFTTKYLMRYWTRFTFWRMNDNVLLSCIIMEVMLNIFSEKVGRPLMYGNEGIKWLEGVLSWKFGFQIVRPLNTVPGKNMGKNRNPWKITLQDEVWKFGSCLVAGNFWTVFSQKINSSINMCTLF